MSTTIPLVLCFDQNYAKYAPIAILSAKRNCKSPIKVYCIALFSDPQKLALLKHDLDEVGVEHTIMVADEAIFDGWAGYLHITKAAYLRLLIPMMVQEERVLYIDCDVLVNDDLSELYCQPMGKHAIGGVPQDGGGAGSKMPLADDDIYINSGVLLMDLVKLRQDDFFARCQDIYRRHKDHVTWCDQCVINKYAENNKLILDERWNKQVTTSTTSKMDWQALLESKSAAVIHFVGSVKPWMEWCNPQIAQHWWTYANQLSCRDRLLQPFSSVQHLILLGQTLDVNEDYKEASQVKGNVIANLLEMLKKKV